MAIVKSKQIKHNNYMMKQFSWWLMALLITVLNFQPVQASNFAEDISTDQFDNYTKCQQEKLKADPLRSGTEIVEECQAENIPTNCNPEGGLGWLICPAIFIVSSASDVSYSFVRSFMEINVDFFKTNTPTFQVWSEIRNIANVGLILFFLLIIGSQLTGFGISNYGLKKAVPKFIMAVILINLSFTISQFMIDISNIVGSSIVKTINSIENVTFSSSQAGGGSVVLGFGGVALAILLSIVTISTLYKMNALLALVMPILITYILAMIITGIMLLVRQAAIIALVAISPIAFLSLIFPRTENFYNKWKQGLVVTLVAFPVIAMLFGTSSFVSKLITHSSPGFLMHALGLAVSGVPMFVAPAMIRRSVSSLPAIGNMVNNAVNRLQNNANSRFNNSRFMALARKRRSQGVDDFLSGKVRSTPFQSKTLNTLVNRSPEKLSNLSQAFLARTSTGQSILKDIDDRQITSLNNLSTQLDETSLAKIMNLATNNRLDTLNIDTDLQEQSRRAIYAAGLTNSNIKEIAGAAMLRQAQAGELTKGQFDSVTSFMEQNGANQSIRNRLSEQSRQSLSAKGRVDMDGYIRGLAKTSTGVSRASIIANGSNTDWNQTNFQNHLQTMGADELAKIHHIAFKDANFANAYRTLYQSNPNFAYVSDAALKDPNLSVKTAKEINSLTQPQT